MATEAYYFVAGNYFCHKQCESGTIYFPAEIAIIKFTFEDGVVQKFHTYINPGNNEGRRFCGVSHDFPFLFFCLNRKTPIGISIRSEKLFGNHASIADPAKFERRKKLFHNFAAD